MTATIAADAEVINPHHERRWLILALLGTAQLMVVLDATVVNIALPSAQKALGFSDANRQWIVTAYSLTFGSLLLLFGRFGDLFGRKRTLMIGLVAFGIVSAIGGAAQSFGMLVDRPRVPGRGGRAAGAVGAVAADDDVHRTAANAASRSGSTARSPAPAERWGCCSAEC